MGFKKDYEIYGDMLMEYKPSIRSLIFNLLYSKFMEKRKVKEDFYIADAKFRLPETYSPYNDLSYIAIIKNEKVIEVIRVNKQTADFLLGKKNKLVQFDPETTVVKRGMDYRNNSFIQNEEINNDKNN